jgi:hypothetical protein
VDFLQLLDADFGVNLRRVQAGVSEHLLNEPDVGPVLVHVGSGAGDNLQSAPRQLFRGSALPSGMKKRVRPLFVDSDKAPSSTEFRA